MDSINSILHAEFFIATGYFDRLLMALTELSDFQNTPTGRELLKQTYSPLEFFFVEQFEFLAQTELESHFAIKTFKKNVKSFQQFMEKWIELPLYSEKKWSVITQYINLNYELSHSLHSYILKYTQYDIQYPRQSLIKEINVSNNDETLTNAKQFWIDFHDINEFKEAQKLNSGIDFLHMKRQEKYDYFLRAGHLKINDKNFEEAKNNFYKAKNYSETAEVFTLIAWTYSLVGDNEKAKNNCLKAIALDPEYGPPYNDFGNYLLAEGQIAESFKWFELAKRATHYQNREYPYINSGRAYMLQKKYREALREFSTALILAPYHDELHDTVKKIKLNFEKNNQMNPHFFNPQDLKMNEQGNFDETR